ncbi:MAG: hypothetical protein MI924_30475, partial [Chloroflexales bacterium]|nr:hypothetical protein [Chloroflexales bacterium]
LTAAETMTLTALLDALPASEQSVDPLPARMSGYQSFTVHLPDRSVQVYHGVVREQSEHGMRYFTDTDQQVELWLYATAQPHLVPDLYRRLRVMIDDPQSSIVVLDIFSGRPNPVWMLAAAETITLTAMLDALPASSKTIDPPEGLGYRSFIVHLPDRSVEVYGGFVSETSGRGLLYFIDTDQRVERWLYATSQPHLDPPDLYQQLDRMITERAQQ